MCVCEISVVGDQERIGRKRNGEPHQRGGGAGDRKCHPFLFSPFCRAQDRTGPTWRVGGGLSSCLFDQIKIKGPLLLLFFFFFFFFPHFFVTRTARHGTEGWKTKGLQSAVKHVELGLLFLFFFHSSLLFCCLGWNDTCGGCGGTEVGTKVRNIKIPITSSQTIIQVHRGRYDAMPLGQRVFPIYCCKTIPMYYIASQTDTVWQAGRGMMMMMS